MMCTSGTGQVYIGGKWRTLTAGMGCLAPRHSFYAYGAIPGQRWEIVWIRYEEPQEALPLVFASQPVLARCKCDALQATVRGLYLEIVSAANPALAHMWTDLIEAYAQAFAKPWWVETRLRAVWEEVRGRLHESWTVERLATLAGLSLRQLRRLHRQATETSLKRYLMSLRMEQAISLLLKTDKKVEAIAYAVGYASLFNFSWEFHAFTGVKPSGFRKAAAPDPLRRER